MGALLWFALALGVAAAGAIVGLRRYQQEQLFKPTASSGPLKPDPGSLNLDFEDIIIDGPAGQPVYAWWLPCSPDASTLLFLHGNRGNLSDRIDSLALYRGLGLNVLGIDYRGYGRSPGKPSEQGLYADAYCAWRYLCVQRQLPPNDIVILGRSLGGAVASELATRVQPGAAVIESTFTSIPRLAKEKYPHLPNLGLTRMAFDNLSRIARISAPLLLVHSREDQVIGLHHAQALANAAPQGTQLITTTGAHSGGHISSGDSYLSPLRRFLVQAGMRMDNEKEG
ncbi:MAG: alpha/beta hydrolase [Gammaproteobacteria bacterium]